MKARLEQERAAKGAGRRGPLPDENSKKAERRQLHEARAQATEEGAAGRGPLPDENSKKAERRQLHEARAQATEEGAAGRGPLPDENSKNAERRQLHEARAQATEEGAAGRGPLPDENSKEAQRRQLHEARAQATEEGIGGRGPLPDENSKEAQRRQLHEARAQATEEGAAGRGPLPDENSKKAERRQLHEARAQATEEGAGSRGPLPDENSKEAQRRQLHEARAQATEEGIGGRGPLPVASEIQQQGYPFPDEDTLAPEQAQAQYLAFARSWSRFGLSRVCEKCQTLTPGRHCKRAKGTEQLLCRNCRENRTKVVLPTPVPIPEALQRLRTIEQHLLAMARISQVLLDKLPSGGPSAQWGRMYAVLMQEPFICGVLEGASLEEDGTVLVEGVDGITASPARLEYLHAALQALRRHHRLYQQCPAVETALARMAAILANKAPAASATEPTDPPPAAQADEEEEVEVTYLLSKQFQAPKADVHDLRKARGSADLSDDLDAKFFPHLFPTGCGGWQNDYGGFAQYARRRLLSADGRFEGSTGYIMWLLEMKTKKRLSGNINVRISNQRTPRSRSEYENGSRRVYAALRDIPGTQPYLYAKKGVALNMNSLAFPASS